MLRKASLHQVLAPSARISEPAAPMGIYSRARACEIMGVGLRVWFCGFVGLSGALVSFGIIVTPFDVLYSVSAGGGTVHGCNNWRF